MKRNLTAAGVTLLLLFLLRFPAESLNAARDGMKLWLNTLLPTLLPFLILTGFLVHTDGAEKILAPFAPVFRFLLGLSPWGSYVFFLGFLCGYPMGAKLASDLYIYGKIEKKEAEYLLTFCNNPSPAFLTTYLAQVCLGGHTKTETILGILLLSDLICMLFFRFVVYRGKTISDKQRVNLKKETPSSSSPEAVIDVSIMNGFETITRLGGYILLFSILAAAISHFWPFPANWKYAVLGITELTTGLHLLAHSGLPYSRVLQSSMILTSFGGFCIMTQTQSVIKGNLSLTPYAAAKLLNAAVTALLVLIFA